MPQSLGQEVKENKKNSDELVINCTLAAYAQLFQHQFMCHFCGEIDDASHIIFVLFFQSVNERERPQNGSLHITTETGPFMYYIYSSHQLANSL